MNWVTITNDLLKITRLATMLSNNGFKLELQNNNLILIVPTYYNFDNFVKSIPITNQFLIDNRTIIIKL